MPSGLQSLRFTVDQKNLFDAELGHYLSVTAEIKCGEKFIDVQNRVVLDIVPATVDEELEKRCCGFSSA